MGKGCLKPDLTLFSFLNCFKCPLFYASLSSDCCSFLFTCTISLLGCYFNHHLVPKKKHQRIFHLGVFLHFWVACKALQIWKFWALCHFADREVQDSSKLIQNSNQSILSSCLVYVNFPQSWASKVTVSSDIWVGFQILVVFLVVLIHTADLALYQLLNFIINRCIWPLVGNCVELGHPHGFWELA